MSINNEKNKVLKLLDSEKGLKPIEFILNLVILVHMYAVLETCEKLTPMHGSAHMSCG